MAPLAFLGIHIELGTIDWDALVAVGTFSLAVFTWNLAKKTADLSTATKRELDKAEAERVETRRPVIVPADFDSLNSDLMEYRPDLQRGLPDIGADGADLILPVTNIGQGPVFNLRGQVNVYSPEGAGFGGGTTIRPREGFGLGTVELLTFTPVNGKYALPQLGDRLHIDVVLAYEDITGRPYWTELNFRIEVPTSTCKLHVGRVPNEAVLIDVPTYSAALLYGDPGASA